MFDNIEKNILDLVTFDDIKISYSVNKDLHVVFTIDPSVHASTRDWVGIYPVGWTAFESCLTYQWGIGRHFENSCRTRYMIFKTRDLRKAKCGTHYQFVYVSKYLDVLGVSQYFQFCATDVPTPGLSSSKQSVRFKSDDCATPAFAKRKLIPLTKSPTPSCRLVIEQPNKVYTSCGRCKSLFDLNGTSQSFTLADKVDSLEKTVADLMASKIVPSGLSSSLAWDEEFERGRFQKFLSDIYGTSKPDGSGEKTVVKNRMDAIRSLVSAMDDVMIKAGHVKSELLKMIESPCDGGGEQCLIDPNASGIIPIPSSNEAAKPDFDPQTPPVNEPAKHQEIGQLASGEPSKIQTESLNDSVKPHEP